MKTYKHNTRNMSMTINMNMTHEKCKHQMKTCKHDIEIENMNYRLIM